MIQLAAPLMLLALALPLLARLLPPRPAPGLAMILPDGVRAAGVRGPGPDGRRGLVALWLVWVLLVLASAQPQRLELAPDRSASGRDILIALDMSGSMATPDFALDGETTTRLAAVKRVAQSFIEARRGDRMGLVVFADRAYVAAPLTHDLPAVTRALHEAEIGISGRSTNISEGLGLALKRILAGDAESRVIVLLSDGRDTAELLDAAQVGGLAAERGVRIHSVALGPEDLETRPAARDAVDVATLREIASASGGETFRVRSTGDLQAMAEALDRLEPNPSTRPPVAVARALWPWPAGAALLLLGLALWRRLA
ncbi:VWA domain-containing protein [Paracoccus sp. Z118]|uniref:VWA domain-containing protein n=1 Tax=Paracoccus sp. Z118 TaxID=2851017 RepID=UPI001C2C6A8B|nr:VWA domain-containing protein [Paracoccus sp. Z118]MBV0892112.1 VWA domain-containing protein [Paracoccus sp. Z118]